MQSPEILAVSAWLESPVGQSASYTTVSIVPVTATILAVAGHPEAAIKTTAAGVLLMTSIISVTFCICGKSLLRVIEQSLGHRRNAIRGDKTYVAEQHVDSVHSVHHTDRVYRVDRVDHTDRVYHIDHADNVLHSANSTGNVDNVGCGNQTLLAAKKKVERTLGHFVRQLVVMICVLGCSIVSKYGVDAPLFMFVTPMTIMPILKLMVGVKLFAGRSRLNASQGLRYKGGGHIRESPTLVGFTNVRHGFHRNAKVVPIEKSSVPDLPPSTTQLMITTQRTIMQPV